MLIGSGYITSKGDLSWAGMATMVFKEALELTEPLPPGAVLVSSNRNDIMPMWYYQYVDGERPDLLGLFPLITPEYPTLGHVLDLGHLLVERGQAVLIDVPTQARQPALSEND